MPFLKKIQAALHRFRRINILLFLVAIALCLGTPQLVRASTAVERIEAQPATGAIEPQVRARRFGWCDGGNPATYNPDYVITPRGKIVWVHGRKIELRYHTSARCAWAKISRGSPGDEIWVDRSSNGGKTWEPKLGDAKINWGYTQKYTVMFDDRDRKMRTCGKAGDRAEIVCTSWF